MDPSTNQLIEAPEDDDIDDLNDETFGDSAENCPDWEPCHEELAYNSFGSGHGYSKGNEDDLDFDDVMGMQQVIQQLVDEDVDEKEDEIRKSANEQKKPSIDLDNLFGPHSPPGLFDVEELAMGQPNIWGSPARDSFLQNRASFPLNSLLQSVFQRAPGMEMPPLQSMDRFGIPDGAKTLEEIECGIIGDNNLATVHLNKATPGVLTVEELERRLRGEDVVPQNIEGVSAVHTRAGSLPMTMPPRPVFHNTGGPAGNVRAPSIPIGSPSGGVPRMPQTSSPSGLMWPQGSNMHLRQMNNASLQQQLMAMHSLNIRYPPGILPGHRPEFMFGQMPYNHGFVRPGVDNMLYNQHRYNGPTNNNPAFMNLMRPNNQQMPFHRLSMPSKAAFPLQRQQIFQQHQMMMMRQNAAARFQSSGLGGGGGLPFAGARQMYDPPPGMSNPDVRNQQGDVDEYAGLMQQREKDWVIKIQLLQLHTDDPYVDDYYFTCWSLKKMLRERKQLEGIQNKDNDSEPSLVLPQLSKTETKAYAPAQFQGALGRLTAASIHNPRKMITLDMGAGQESDELRSIEVKRFKEVLLRIEKGFDCLLDIEDAEKKALAQPHESRQSLYDERKRMITQLYRRLKWASGDGHMEKPPGDNGDDGLSQIISIHKGLMLVLRLLPLLDKMDTHAVIRLLLHKLATKKDWQTDVLLMVFRAISRVVDSASLEDLVTFAVALTTGKDAAAQLAADKNSINRLVIAMQNKLGLSVILCLLNRGEVIYSTQSQLDLDVVHQNNWRAFVETTASALELCDKSSLVQPLESFHQVLGHFRRVLDKRWVLSVEDKLEAVAVKNAVKTSIT